MKGTSVGSGIVKAALIVTFGPIVAGIVLALIIGLIVGLTTDHKPAPPPKKRPAATARK